MSFVSLGGDGGLRPTFFELIAADRLMPSLKSAAIYSLSVFAQRRHFLQRALSYDDEIAALLALLLDWQSLANNSASFADSLYGLRRAPYEKVSDSKPATLSRRQQRLALLSLVVVPYIQAKAKKFHDSLNSSESQFRLQSSAPAQASSQSPLLEKLMRLSVKGKRIILRLMLKLYLYMSCLWEAAVFAYQLLYLLDSSPFYSPLHHMLGQHIIRVSGTELANSEQVKASRRQGQLKLAQSKGRWLGMPATLVMKAGHLLADHTRNALILSVFGFKLLEWWFLSAEQKVLQQKQLPVPPPPPNLKPHPDGLSLPKSESVCPLCRLETGFMSLKGPGL